MLEYRIRPFEAIVLEDASEGVEETKKIKATLALVATKQCESRDTKKCKLN